MENHRQQGMVVVGEGYRKFQALTRLIVHIVVGGAYIPVRPADFQQIFPFLVKVTVGDLYRGRRQHPPAQARSDYPESLHIGF
jgi:hypothetical protein